MNLPGKTVCWTMFIKCLKFCLLIIKNELIFLAECSMKRLEQFNTNLFNHGLKITTVCFFFVGFVKSAVNICVENVQMLTGESN